MLTRQLERAGRGELLTSRPHRHDVRFEHRLRYGRELLPLVGLAVRDMQLGQPCRGVKTPYRL